MKPPELPVLCQAVVESGQVSYNAVISRDGEKIAVVPFGRETHSTTAFNGVAVVTPCSFKPSLPRSMRSAGCSDILRELSQRIPNQPGTGLEVYFIPFS